LCVSVGEDDRFTIVIVVIVVVVVVFVRLPSLLVVLCGG